MNNADIFQPLEILEKKPVPKQFDRVRLFYKRKDEIGNDQETDIPEKVDMEQVDGMEETKVDTVTNKPAIKVVDRRRENVMDREAIMNRLRARMPVQLLSNIPSSRETILVAEEKKTEPVRQLTLQSNLEEDDVQDVTLVGKEGNEYILEKSGDEEAKLAEVPIEPIKKIQKKRKLRIVGTVEEEEPVVDLTTAVIRTQKVADRLPSEKEKIIVKAPSYYMNNRKIFIQKLTELFKPYQKELLDTQESASCDNRSNNKGFDMLTHQKIVRDYLNLYTPYRGLLLYHGLGSGKTCTSIAIAEGMKSSRRVFVLTPASLKMNFFSEMKKCGDDMYKKNQYWEFISIDGKPEYVGILTKALSLSSQFVRSQGGAWLVNINKESNYESLDSSQQESLDEQLNQMIRSKYTDINYNAPNLEKQIHTLSGGFTHNPFDNSVIVIDEAHNFVSRIVNKLKQPTKIAYKLYDYIMSATNAKVVLLTGTPIINYPHEIGVLYNLLRGYIVSWTIPIEWQKRDKLNEDTILTMLDKANIKTHDSVEYGDNKLTITRNPFGFVNTKKRGVAKGTKRVKKGGKKRTTKKARNLPKERFAEKLTLEEEYTIEQNADVELSQRKGHNGDDRYSGGASEAFDKYNGVKLDDSGNITNKDFLEKILQVLKSNGATVLDKQIKQTNHKALPDSKDAFEEMFVDVDSGDAKNMNLFKRRILGLSSYFRSAQEDLLPRYVKTEGGDVYHVEKLEMTDHQFGIYEKIRKVEQSKEKNIKNLKRMKKSGKDDLFTVSSTYRIFSRAACNFTFPTDIDRPVPNIKEGEEVTEKIMDIAPTNAVDINVEETSEVATDAEKVEGEDESVISNKEEDSYARKIESALEALNANKEDSNEKLYLSKDALNVFSPKFAKILENVTAPTNEGLHLIYSHFRTLEGVGILRLILLANGFAEFKIKKTGSSWELIEEPGDKGKPKFVLYTGTETAEEKEIIRNVYNSMWEYVPSTIANAIREINDNNTYGEVIKVMMITSSGAEGINLRNTRFVHIVEPYWHMVRVEQVVGRARRICSHQDLPEDMRTVKVYLYVSTLSEKHQKDEKHIELQIRDVSRVDEKTPITTDENLYELASIKQRINNQILTSIKESAIDCNIYANTTKQSDEQLVCYGFGKVESNQFSSYPSFDKDQHDKGGLDTKKITWKGKEIMENGVKYVLNPNTNEIYDFNSYERVKDIGGELIMIGRLIKDKQGLHIEKI
jgi:hypothetical protein|uniref:Helicase ATP-binding domain-containing protein n=1 Tax=viral metagenome TaxID=1070528 RepID=A0A6C0IQ25_9ZZZZ